MLLVGKEALCQRAKSGVLRKDLMELREEAPHRSFGRRFQVQGTAKERLEQARGLQVVEGCRPTETKVMNRLIAGYSCLAVFVQP